MTKSSSRIEDFNNVFFEHCPSMALNLTFNFYISLMILRSKVFRQPLMAKY